MIKAWESKDYDLIRKFVTYSDGFDNFFHEEYKDSWDSLMDIVEGIEDLPEDEFHGKFGVYISSNSCTIQGTRLITTIENFHPAYFSDHYGDNKYNATKEAVLHFLNWYNESRSKMENITNDGSNTDRKQEQTGLE